MVLKIQFGILVGVSPTVVKRFLALTGPHCHSDESASFRDHVCYSHRTAANMDVKNYKSPALLGNM